ncbi:hypothetical protein L1889_16670 [Paenalcaligenes niemegkensis]|uniref:hypothetical protein n=1 Tax=Paenalcaligenes niemegkensis TaxID=2895469 RepID=UPI001EE87888|nr:hypothetical protein [Paenalcaligenes niemegkensis]MCQ9618106.1 hypothetical protein [Paenalcaligenes niemegkensis]
MDATQVLKQLLERNQIDPSHFDLESFRADQQNFQQNLQKIRDLNPDLALEPIQSVHQVLKGKAQ